MDEIRQLLTRSLVALKKGHGHGMNGDINNVYVKGSPGRERTLSVEVVLKKMVAEQLTGVIKGEIPIFEAAKLNGTELHDGTFYNTIAKLLEISNAIDGRCEECDAKATVLDRFFGRREECDDKATFLARCYGLQCPLKGETINSAPPVTILWIDEIDKAPWKHVQDLLYFASLATNGSDTYNYFATGQFDCRVIIVGTSDTYPSGRAVRVACKREEVFKVVVFEP